MTWSVVTKHETIKERVKELIQMKTEGQSKEERDDYCMDLAYAVREASLFRITGSNIEKAKKLLDQYIEERMDPETKKLLNEAIRTKNGNVSCFFYYKLYYRYYYTLYFTLYLLLVHYVTDVS